MASIDGSTNAVVHSLAIAGRLRIDLPVDDFDRIGSHVPLLVDLLPGGRSLVEDFHRAGGRLAVLREVRDLLDPAALTVTGRPWSSTSRRADWDPEASGPFGAADRRGRDRRSPRQPRAGWSVDQAGRRVAAPAAAPRPCGRLRQNRDFHARIDDPDLDVEPTLCWYCAAAAPGATPGFVQSRECPV
jgi:hypothetical protein